MGLLRAGRYVLHSEIASGGMASVHLGRAVGTGGFARTVAIKRLHPHLARDPDFVRMFLDEARIASRVHHPNVVATLDVVAHEGELLLVMEHVLGDSWWSVLRLMREQNEPAPLDVVSAVLVGLLSGLHAAHEARTEGGAPLEVVHRDVSPHNVLVGIDGVARVVDFGIAKAISRVHSTRDGEVKGKLSYMAPEQVNQEHVDARTDIYAAGVVLWESLTGARLYEADNPGAVIQKVLEGDAPAPSSRRQEVPPALDALVLRALAVDPADRPSTAAELAAELEAIVPPASPRVVGDFLARVAASHLAERRRLISELEQTPSDGALHLEHKPPSLGWSTPEQRRALAAADTAVTLVPASADPATGPASPERPRRRRAAAGAIAVALAALLGVGGYLRWPRALTAKDASASSSAMPPASSAPAESLVPASALSLAPSPRAAEAPPAASASAGTTTGHVRRPPRRVASPAVTATTSARPPANDCNPSYTLDENGVKRFKPWCI